MIDLHTVNPHTTYLHTPIPHTTDIHVPHHRFSCTHTHTTDVHTHIPHIFMHPYPISSYTHTTDLHALIPIPQMFIHSYPISSCTYTHIFMHLYPISSYTHTPYPIPEGLGQTLEAVRGYCYSRHNSGGRWQVLLEGGGIEKSTDERSALPLGGAGPAIELHTRRRRREGRGAGRDCGCGGRGREIGESGGECWFL